MDIFIAGVLIVFCLIGLVVFFGLMLLAINYRVQSGLRYAKQIDAAIARGAFNDTNTPQHKPRFRWLGVMGLIGLVGSMAMIGLLFLQMWGSSTYPSAGYSFPSVFLAAWLLFLV